MPQTFPKKAKTFGFRWAPARKERWEHLARVLGKDPGVFAREVIEDFFACYLTDADLMQLGMMTHLGKRGGGWIEVARREAEFPSTTNPRSEPNHDGDTGKKRKHG